MHQLVASRLELEMDLRDAIGTDQFFLVYQPTFAIDDGATTGVEALDPLAAPDPRSDRTHRVHPDPRRDRPDRPGWTLGDR